MRSFWAAIGGGLKKIVKGADKVIDVLEPFEDEIRALVPGPFGAFLKFIFDLERLSDARAKGADRKVGVMALFRLKYPTVDQAKLDPLVDQQISILNALAAAVEEAERK